MAKTERLRRSFFPQPIRLLNTNSLYNLCAHSSCTFLLILLFMKSTVYFPAHFIIFYSLFLFFYLFFFILIFRYILLCCVIYNCTVHGVDQTYISLLVIFCINVYVRKTNHEYFKCILKTENKNCIYPEMYFPLHGNFELHPLGATMGNASSVTRA